MNSKLFYKDEPLFGLDIGSSSVKVMQIVKAGRKQKVVGYGAINYDPSVMKDSVIENPEPLAKAVKHLFEKGLIGGVTTRRAALSVPVAKTYNRVMTLPKMNIRDLSEAVKSEAAQYIPVPIDDLYIDYNITSTLQNNLELLVTAVPKKIIDSYVSFAKLVNIEIGVLETTISASSRLVGQTELNDVPTILIDFGSSSVDMTIYEKQLIVTGTVSGGGETFTDLISKKLDVSKQAAYTIKTKYGLGLSKKQREVEESLKPILSSLSKELRKMIRYYNERTGSEDRIKQIITMGGGANMPGLSEYLTDELRLACRMCDPWTNLDFGHLQPPSEIEKSMYITAAGLSMINPKEIWQ
jgi:type IV pilus assembly protein PilM